MTGGKFIVSGLMEKLGVTTDTITVGKNGTLNSINQPFSETERAAMKHLMDDTYHQFVAKAAKGRKMTFEQLDKLAGGRVYTGRQAQKLGLVDEVGTLDDALAAAKQLADIPGENKPRIAHSSQGPGVPRGPRRPAWKTGRSPPRRSRSPFLYPKSPGRSWPGSTTSGGSSPASRSRSCCRMTSRCIEKLRTSRRAGLLSRSPTLRVGMPSSTLCVVFALVQTDRQRTRSVRDGIPPRSVGTSAKSAVVFREKSRLSDLRSPMPMPTLTLEQLEALKKYNTPTIANAIEIFNLRGRHLGFCRTRSVVCFPTSGRSSATR